MSLLRRGLNTYLKWTEKTHLARADDVDTLRHGFERRARFFFHGPFGARYHWEMLDGVPAQWACARGGCHQAGPLILYFHGGGYVFGSTNTHRAMLARLSDFTGLPVCLVDYRLAPEHPFPAAIQDALAAYGAVLDRSGGVIFGGDSAGGGLALALLGEVLRLGLPTPRGVFGFSPLTDLTFSGASVVENEARDVMLPASRIAEIAEIYLNGGAADEPRASPLRADFTGAPPVWLVVGDTEILRDDTVRMATHLRAQSVDVSTKIADDLPHVWPIFHNILPEARVTLQDLAAWIRQQVG